MRSKLCFFGRKLLHRTAIGGALLAVLVIALSAFAIVTAPEAGASGASQFSGTVLDGSGNPVPDASISLTEQGNPTNSYSVSTAADGTFSVFVNSGVYTVSVIEPVGDGDPTDLNVRGTVDLSDSQVGVSVQFPNTPDSITVDVNDTADQPVSNIGVSVVGNNSCAVPSWSAPAIFSSPSFSESMNGDTDDTGTVTFPSAACSGFSFNVNTQSLGTYYGSSTGPYALSGPTTVTATVTPVMTTLGGSVRTPGGISLPNVSIQMWSLTSGDVLASTTSDQNGLFQLPSFRTGGDDALIVSGSTPDGLEQYRFVTYLQPNGSQPSETLTIPLSQATISVSDPDGNPVAGATVTRGGSCTALPPIQVFPGANIDSFVQSGGAWNENSITWVGSPGVVTDANGTATYDTLPCAAGFTLQVTPPSGSTLAGETVSPDIPVGPWSYQVVIGSLDGVIVDSAGQPLANQQLSFVNTNGSVTVNGSSDSAGTFALDVPPGQYTSTVSGSLGDPTSYRVSITRVIVSGPMRVTILVPVRALTLRVTGPTGDPVAGATIGGACSTVKFNVLGKVAKGKQCPSELTNASGVSTLDVIESGSANVKITPSMASGLKSRTVKITSSTAASITVQLK